MKNTTAALHVQSSPSPPARELVEKTVPLVKSIVARLRVTYGSDFAFDDLYEIGIDGLMRAAEKFDPDRGASFATYAYYRIRGTILDSLRRKPEFQRGTAGDGLAIAPLRAPSLAANDNGRPDDGRESSQDRVRWVFADAAMVRLASPKEIGAIPDESAARADEEADRSRLAERVAGIVATLPEIERRVIELHYYEDLSFAEVGEKLGICKPWAFRLHNKALKALKDKLGELSDLDDLLAVS
jgi:RNA polymerase sigma factor for flagellar operon FliA